MKYLWDTHTFLWWVSGSAAMSHRARTVIEEASHEPWLSIASLWEIAIKASLGKLDISGTYERVMDDVQENGIQLLPITFQHTLQQYTLPFHHRDPFDRMLIAQALTEQMPIISADTHLDLYRIQRIW